MDAIRKFNKRLSSFTIVDLTSSVQYLGIKLSSTMSPGPQGRTEASCIVTDWVSQVKEEIKKERHTSKCKGTINILCCCQFAYNIEIFKQLYTNSDERLRLTESHLHKHETFDSWNQYANCISNCIVCYF